MNRDPTPPSEHRQEVPKALDEVVLRCMLRNSDDRFADVAELAEALSPFASPAFADAGTRVRRVLETPPRPSVVTDSDPGAASGSGSIKGWESTTGRDRASRIGWLAAGVVVAAVAGFLVFGRGSTATLDPPSEPSAADAPNTSEPAAHATADNSAADRSAADNAAAAKSVVDDPAAAGDAPLARASDAGAGIVVRAKQPSASARSATVGGRQQPRRAAPRAQPRPTRAGSNDPDLYNSRH